MKETNNVVILVTTSNAEESQKIADLLLNRRKAACVNIVTNINSIFWWQGKIDSSAESLLIIKTKTSLLSEVVSLVKDCHSYKVPEIIALPIIGGNEDYLRWINSEVTEK